MKVIDLLNKLSTARMEYQSPNHSVYHNFVVPYFIDNFDLRESSHSIALVGSRGSGKSTYIKYFSHSTRFDKKRSTVGEDEFNCIVLYWKPDTAYCQGLMPEWLGNSAIHFFMLHAALSLLNEICDMLLNVIFHFPDVQDDISSNKNFFHCLKKITGQPIQTLEELKFWVRDTRYDISTRLNPVNTENMPSIEPNSMLSYVIDCLREDCSRFRDTIFRVYVDEFELLNSDQQKLINTYRKESSKIINWNVAYKSNAALSNQTTSDQWLQKPDDYREHNIDEYIKSDYTVYAAEIFLLTLQNAGLHCSEIQLTPEFLGERDNLKHRGMESYRKMAIDLVGRILPTPTIRELSAFSLKSDIIKSKLTELVKDNHIDGKTFNQLLKNESLAVTLIGTSRQKNFDVSLYLKYLKGDKDAIKKIDDKIHSYELNTLLSFNLQNPTLQIPVYAGFERYITMTTPNIRHFKELCYSAIRHFYEKSKEFNNIDSISDISAIPLVNMHEAAIYTSTDLVKEVISYPPHGNKMSQLINRVGELFKISQKSTYQTEPERVIFTIEYDFAGDDRDLEDFIRSARSWRVLIVDDSKRIKNDMQMTSLEFQLNPIYSPRFGISIRKKRGISFTVEQFKCLITGNNSQYLAIRKNYQKKWRVEDDDLKQGLLL